LGLRAIAIPPTPRPIERDMLDDDEHEARLETAATERLRAIRLAVRSIELVIADSAARRSVTWFCVSTGDDTHRTIDAPPLDALTDATEFLRA